LPKGEVIPQPNVVLFGRANSDIVTVYMDAWHESVFRSILMRRDLRVINLRGKDFTKANVERIISEQDPGVVFLTGHGLVDSLYGQENKVVFKAGENTDILAGRIVHAMSCLTARIMGPEVVKQGGIAYIGYKENFIFYTRAATPKNILDDDFARSFFGASIVPMVSLLDGKSIEQAFNDCENAYTLAINKWQKVRSSDASAILSGLLWDRQNLTFIGNGEARGVLPQMAPPHPVRASLVPQSQGMLAIGAMRIL